MRPDVPSTTAAASGAEFAPLAPMLNSISPETMDKARRRVARLDRDALIDRFRAAFGSSKRTSALILSDELTARGVPPCLRLDHRSLLPATLEQKFDLFLFDVRWLRRHYPEHVGAIRYKRYQQLLSFAESAHHREVEFVFYGGKRPAWQIVASMSLTTRQQWDCTWLRSAPIAKHHSATHAARDRVSEALQNELQSVRRTKTFSDGDAHATLIRWHTLWLCSRMTGGGPTETAARYTQLTGIPISRQSVANQLEKVGKILRKTGLTL